ncbi:MAG TPA: amino acid adenylation domain-containing protein [Thermoanaerobaculia bacterium]|nr:amino acid adenylation domain-containing protein [Thermoanaerobaculia bacterium]
MRSDVLEEVYAFPASFSQERLWFLAQIQPASPVYNIPAVTRLEGAFDLPTLERALAEILRRHEVLRTRFAARDGQPLQLVSPDGVVPLRFVDLRDRSRSAAAAEARRLLELEARRPFDLSRGPLVRACVLRLAEEETVLGVVMHHIVSDGWSMRVFFQELSALVEAFGRGRPSPLPELPIQYADYACWQREQLQGERLEELLGYWRSRLGGAPELLALPTDRPRPAVERHRGGLVFFRLDAALTEALEALGRERGATPFMTLLAGFLALLHRFTAEDDLVVGTPVANRTRPEVEGLVGFFVNTLALRTDLSGPVRFGGLVERVRDEVLGALAHQDLPFEKLVGELQSSRSLGHNPLFQVMFALQTAEEAAPGAAAGAGEPEWGTGTAKFDLSLILAEAPEGIAGAWEFSADLFDPATLDHLSRRFRQLLAAVVEDPERPLSDLQLLTLEERRMLESWSTPAPAPAPDRCLHELFAAQAERVPERIAVVQGDRSVTYGELDRMANGLAHRLRNRGVGPETGVVLAMERSPEAVAAMLAALQAGGFFVPLDPGVPAGRLRYVQEDVKAAAVVTRADVADSSDTGPRVPVDLSHPAYAIYTSGSTGLPKGVLVEHGTVVGHLLTVSEAYGLSEGDVVLQFASLGFDPAIEQIFATLLAGARLVLRDEPLWSPAELLDRIVAHGVSVLNLPPAYWLELAHLWAHAPERARGHRLRLVLIGGEAMPPEGVRLWRRTPAAAARLLNAYGPTEATIDATLFEVIRDFDGRVPIGRSLAGRTMHVLDRYGNPAPPGVPGELCLGGRGLARGYLGRPDLTAEKFVPDPFAAEPGARLYRTGDLARLLPDGNADVLGRIDNQIKLRGFRVEPGEIEAALARHPGVRHALVVAVAAEDGGVELAAYVVAAAEALPDPDELRRLVASSLPAYMVPRAFVRLDAMPTKNGKVDRRALPSVSLITPIRSDEAPATGTEERLAALWCEVLGCERADRRADRNTSFFEAGGHSLSALRLLARIARAFGAELPLRALFENPTLAGLAAVLGSELRSPASDMGEPPLVRVPRTADLPLSFAQERLWFLSRLEPASPLYNVPMLLPLTEPLDLAAIEEGLRALARRHEVLRTRFIERAGRPVLAIDAEWNGTLDLIDLPHLAYLADAEPVARVAAEAARPFDVEVGPLFRAVLLRPAGRSPQLLLTLHHVVTDAWSAEILVRELGELVEAARTGRSPRLPDLPVQYADFAVWQRALLSGERLERLTGFWSRELAGAPQVLELPADRPRPAVPTYRGGALSFPVGDAAAQGVRELARAGEATEFMVLLAIFQALLLRLTAQEDLVVGVPLANRPRVELEGLIGFFSNTLVLRTSLAGSPSLRELVGRVRRTALDAFAHQELPFERLVEELQPERRLGINPLFQVLFSLQKGVLSTGSATASPPETGTAAAGTGTAKFDLSLFLIDHGPALSGAVEYASDLFDDATVLRLIGHFTTLLEELVRDPDRAIDGVPLLTGPERRQLVAWNLRPVPPLEEAGLDVLFARQAAATPEAVALVGAGGERLTYDELARASSSLATRLRRLGVGPDVRVGICLGRSPRMAVAVLATLQAGGACVPLDPSFPAERLAFMLEDSGAALVLVERATAGRLPEGGPRRLGLDGLDGETSPEDGTEVEMPAALPLDRLVYVLYTSGSTGRPKGVAMPHRPVANLLTWQLGASEPAGPAATLQFSSPSFDVSYQELFLTWLSGGTLVLPSEEARLDPAALLRLLAAERIERLFLPFVALRQLADAAAGHTVEDLALREVITAGEALQITPAVAGLFARLPGCRLRNQYGPTENHVVTDLTLAGDPAGWDPLPTIGRPIPGARIWALDDRGDLLPVGIPGGLYIGGIALARGYLGRPDLTAERFLPDPWSPEPGARMYQTGDVGRYLPTGEIQFLGRSDFQLKIRGYRVEVGEVEAVLSRAPGVAQAVVTAGRDASGSARLVAYVVTAEGAPPDAGVLERHAREHLPDYMVPSRFVRLATLPKTATGKVDRRALPEPAGPDDSGECPHPPPHPGTDRELARIFGEVLGRTGVGADDDFFRLGGHSLLATQAVSRIRDAFGVDLPLRTLFELPTPGRLTAAVATAQLATADPAQVDVLLGEIEGLADEEAAERLAALDEAHADRAA